MHLPKKEYISAVSDYMNKFVYPITDAMDDNDSLNTNRAYEDVFTSVSISGIDTRSGFKKRSKRRLYFTGSIFVIPSR